MGLDQFGLPFIRKRWGISVQVVLGGFGPGWGGIVGPLRFLVDTGGVVFVTFSGANSMFQIS